MKIKDVLVKEAVSESEAQIMKELETSYDTMYHPPTLEITDNTSTTTASLLSTPIADHVS